MEIFSQNITEEFVRVNDVRVVCLANFKPYRKFACSLKVFTIANERWLYFFTYFYDSCLII